MHEFIQTMTQDTAVAGSKRRSGDLIRVARESVSGGMTQAELAEALNVNQSFVSRLEAGATVSVDVFNKLISVLRTLSPIDLLQAKGYEVTATGADRLNRGMVMDLLSLTDAELESVAYLVHQLAQRARPPAGRGQ